MSEVLLLFPLSGLLSGVDVSSVFALLLSPDGFVPGTSDVFSFCPALFVSCLSPAVSFLTTSVVVFLISSAEISPEPSLLTSVSWPLSATTFAVPSTAASLTLKPPPSVFSAVPVTLTTFPAESFPSNTISPASLIVASPVSVTVLPSASLTCICMSFAFATVALSVDCSIFPAAVSFFAPQAVTAANDNTVSPTIIYFLIIFHLSNTIIFLFFINIEIIFNLVAIFVYHKSIFLIKCS